MITPSTPRFTTNAASDIAIIGNTPMTAPVSDPPAANARNGFGSKTNHNDFNIDFVDVDQDSTTFEAHAKAAPHVPPLVVPIAGEQRSGILPMLVPVSDVPSHFAVLSPGSLTVGGPFSRSSKTDCC